MTLVIGQREGLGEKPGNNKRWISGAGQKRAEFWKFVSHDDSGFWFWGKKDVGGVMYANVPQQPSGWVGAGPQPAIACHDPWAEQRGSKSGNSSSKHTNAKKCGYLASLSYSSARVLCRRTRCGRGSTVHYKEKTVQSLVFAWPIMIHLGSQAQVRIFLAFGIVWSTAIYSTIQPKQHNKSLSQQRHERRENCIGVLCHPPTDEDLFPR